MQNYDVKTLDKVKINQECTIRYVIYDNMINIERLLDLGFVEGAKVTPLFYSMFGDTCAFKVKGSVVGLRKTDSKHILVN